MPTIRDLVKQCPGCGRTVVWPFTQDFDLRYIRVGEGRPASKDELAILKKHMPGLISAKELGVRIWTVKKGEELWHEPCWLMQDIVREHIAMEQIAEWSERKRLMTRLAGTLYNVLSPYWNRVEHWKVG